MWILVTFGCVIAAYGLFVIGLTYRYRARGDLTLAIAHGVVLIAVGAFAIAAAVAEAQRALLIGVAGVLLLGDALARRQLARRRE